MNHETRSSCRPLIAITSDLMIRKDLPTSYLTMTYVDAISKAGGVPAILPPIEQLSPVELARFDGFVLSGGDDPQMEPFGGVTHPKSTPVLEARQESETRLLGYLNETPDKPLLCICLGMQMLALSRGGRLNQHLPDSHPDTHQIHWGEVHEIRSADETILPSGEVWSSHRQAVDDPADLRILARSTDGVIEAVDDPTRVFTLGIQWHPERTANDALGIDLFRRLVTACSV